MVLLIPFYLLESLLCVCVHAHAYHFVVTKRKTPCGGHDNGCEYSYRGTQPRALMELVSKPESEHAAGRQLYPLDISVTEIWDYYFREGD